MSKSRLTYQSNLYHTFHLANREGKSHEGDGYRAMAILHLRNEAGYFAVQQAVMGGHDSSDRTRSLRNLHVEVCCIITSKQGRVGHEIDLQRC